MSFVKQAKYVSALIAVVTVLLVIYSYIQAFQSGGIQYWVNLTGVESKNLLSLTAQQWTALIWEVFWIIVGMAFFIYVAKRAKNVHQDLEHRLEKFEKGWLTFAMIGLMIAAAITIPIAQPVVSNLLISPNEETQKVYVTASQFKFDFHNTSNELKSLSANKYIEFHVNTTDVTHGFGVYDSEGHLVFQMQVVPGYDNVGKVKLSPGTYSVYCLEYCGSTHHLMREINVFTVA